MSEEAALSAMVHETLARICLGSVQGDEPKFLKLADEVAKALRARYGDEAANALEDPLATMLVCLLTTKPTREVLAYFLHDEDAADMLELSPRAAAQLKGLADAVLSVEGEGVAAVYGGGRDNRQMAALDDGPRLVAFVGDVLDGLHEVVARTHAAAEKMEADITVVEHDEDAGANAVVPAESTLAADEDEVGANNFN